MRDPQGAPPDGTAIPAWTHLGVPSEEDARWIETVCQKAAQSGDVVAQALCWRARCGVVPYALWIELVTLHPGRVQEIGTADARRALAILRDYTRARPPRRDGPDEVALADLTQGTRSL